ncbi:ankyrin [Penicillium verhagenii]|uniref:ankyrin n=1 Tax=Penicillium verhagenii TaxID=1562060 RepID=UPI0025453666|nr:ankyrin [Penicillium verhagenii]KAJ5930317.1 ankyrin [Penicillium verhagenii]
MEDFIHFLLDQGCSIQDSNLYMKVNTTKPGQLQTELVLLDTVLAAAIPHTSYQLVSRLITEGANIYAWLAG